MKGIPKHRVPVPKPSRAHTGRKRPELEEDHFEMYGWKIDRDLIDLKLAGTVGPRGIDPAIEEALEAGKGQKFRLKDDDGTVYCEGRLVGKGADGFEPLDDFGMPGLGCTEIEYWENGKWELL